jgi:peptide/nickel transport system substrate-binding protein
MTIRRFGTSALSGMLLGAALTVTQAAPVAAQDLEGGTLRVAILLDVSNFDPQSFLAVNFPLIKNLYDSLLEYTPDGEAIPSLASAWEIAPDNTSVTLTLRDDVTFHSGAPFTAEAVAATLAKAADPQTGKNVYATMSPVADWMVNGPHSITLDFTGPVPTRQITDLLQFISVIDPAGIDTVETVPAGTGAFTLVERVLGQSVTMAANPNYWRDGEPVLDGIEITVFSDNDAAAAALESGAVDLIYGGSARAAVRLRDAGFQLIQGPGPLVQVFRINTTRGPFQNEKFRQAFNHLMDREGILRVGYGGLGQVTALPWAPASPAADPSYNDMYPFDLDKAKALLAESGLSPAEMSGWQFLVNGASQDAVTISQVVQGTLASVGINVELDLKQGAEFTDSMLGGQFTAMFGGIGNIQKFPSRIATNSIYRTANNPVLGEPHPHPDYVEAIARVDNAFTPEDVQAAYDNLNRVLVEASFGIPTNTYDVGLIVAAPNVQGFTLDIDNMLVARTLGFAR